jgi:hypothetical protein
MADEVPSMQYALFWKHEWLAADLYTMYCWIFSENVLGYSGKTVLTACTNTMHSWGLEMFWVIVWRPCLLLVQKLRTGEFVWKCSGLFCENSAYCLCKHYAQLRPGNVLGRSVKTVLTACINTMHRWICMEMFWVMLCRQSLLLVQKLCTDEFVQKFIRIKFINENVYSYGRNK